MTKHSICERTNINRAEQIFGFNPANSLALSSYWQSMEKCYKISAFNGFTMFEERKINMHDVVGTHDVVLITLDTLRFDVAEHAFTQGKLPALSRWLPSFGFERRHTPGSFTFAAHQAFLAGFLPTCAQPSVDGRAHPRLFALAFPGSESTTENTYVFSHGASLPQAFAHIGYRSICIGGVGFFNKCNPLGRVLPDLFEESYWHEDFGVTHPHSTDAQVAHACEVLKQRSGRTKKLLAQSQQRVFMLLNISAIHQPNSHYMADAQASRIDDVESHEAALCYVDQALAPLWDALSVRGPALVIICSDHGTAYGEDGFFGHRNAHPVVMNVPYAHFVVPKNVVVPRNFVVPRT